MDSGCLLPPAGLENDEYVRQIEGYLPTTEVAFIDEIFKANSAILNALLTLLNERLFDNGNQRLRVPLLCLVGMFPMILHMMCMWASREEHFGAHACLHLSSWGAGRSRPSPCSFPLPADSVPVHLAWL